MGRAPTLWCYGEGSVEGVHKVKSAFWVSCRRSGSYPFSDLVLRQKVVAHGDLCSVFCAISGVLALVSVAILRIWFGLESGLLRGASSVGVLRVVPSFVSASRLTLVGLASARRARGSCFSRVSVSSSPVKCVQVKGLQVSITSLWWEICSFDTAPPFGCSFPCPPGSLRLPWRLGLVPAIKCWGFCCQRDFSALIKVVIVSGSQLRIGSRL